MAMNERKRSSGGAGGAGGNRKRMKRKVCAFCMDKATAIDYKDINKLRKYVTERGKDSTKKNFRKLCKTSKNAYSIYKKSKKYSIITIYY